METTQNLKITSEIVTKTLLAHEAVEDVKESIKKAIDDRRYKMSLGDSRAFRDLCDDIQIMLNEAWRGALQIPIEGTAEKIN